jgi:hypothetical protein
VWTKALVRSALVALVAMVFLKKREKSMYELLFIYMYVLICIEMSMLVHMYLYISGCRGIHVSRCRLLSRCGLGGIETPDVGFRFRQGSSARSACAESLVGCDEGFSRAFSAR